MVPGYYPEVFCSGITRMTVGGPVIVLSNDVRMPAVGLGTWQVSAPCMHSQSNPGEVKEAVRVALDEGYRLIDTAAAYENEEEIGKALADYFATGKLKRDGIFITTKVGLQLILNFQAWTTHLHPAKIENGIRGSLERLGLDHLDLYLAHMPAAFNVCTPMLQKGRTT